MIAVFFKVGQDLYSCFALQTYIIDNIGSYYCFFPSNLCLDPTPGPLRCYEDTNGIIKFTDLPCDTSIIYSVDKNSAYNLMKIYPNPAHSVIFINADELPGVNYSVSVYSASGQLLIYLTGLKDNSEIDIEKLYKGLYFVKIEFDDQQTITGKFLKE